MKIIRLYNSRQTSPNGLTIELPYLRVDKDWHGNERIFVRRHGRNIRPRETPGTSAFQREYADALQQIASLDRTKKAAEAIRPLLATIKPHTFGWVAARYFGSGEFAGLDPVSQRRIRTIIDSCLQTDFKGEPMRACPVSMLTAAKIKFLRDAKMATKGAANKRLQYLSAMFGWAVEDGCMLSNPVRDVKKLKYATDGFHTWTVEEVQQFERQFPIGTKPRLALALMLYLGVRRSDVVKIGPGIVKEGVLSLVPQKTRYKRLTISYKPILPELARIIETTKIGTGSFLETARGKAFSAAGFGNWFRDRCNEAGLQHCTCHGLRKAGATIAAERGATTNQLMAIFVWTTPHQAEVYTRKADRKLLTREGMKLCFHVRERVANIVPPIRRRLSHQNRLLK
jgi:integrase